MGEVYFTLEFAVLKTAKEWELEVICQGGGVIETRKTYVLKPLIRPVGFLLIEGCSWVSAKVTVIALCVCVSDRLEKTRR